MIASSSGIKAQELTPESITAYLTHEKENGASADCLRQRRTHITGLYDWLPADKTLSYDLLRQWRESLHACGYSQTTVSNYIKNINRYLDFIGRSDLRFNKGKAKDLTGQQFGYITALAPTEERDRKDVIWRCQCRCGKEVLLPATRLLTGNTQSCGCIVVQHLQTVNQYIDHTSIRSALEEKVESIHAASGYTGVIAKRGKWQAYITYKGKRYSLGCYTKIEDAVKARAYAKDMARDDAVRLLTCYEALHKDASPLLSRKQTNETEYGITADNAALL